MRLRPLILAVLAVVLVAFPFAAKAAPPAPRIAYVDMQRVLLEVEESKAAKARLQKWLDARQKESDAEQESLRREKELLDKQASSMNDEVRQQKASELQRKVLVLGQKWEKSRSEAADRERKEMEPILGRIDQVVATVAKREGVNWVFEKRDAGVRYADPAFDLTNDVIRDCNALLKPAAQPVKK